MQRNLTGGRASREYKRSIGRERGIGVLLDSLRFAPVRSNNFTMEGVSWVGAALGTEVIGHLSCQH